MVLLIAASTCSIRALGEPWSAFFGAVHSGQCRFVATPAVFGLESIWTGHMLAGKYEPIIRRHDQSGGIGQPLALSHNSDRFATRLTNQCRRTTAQIDIQAKLKVRDPSHEFEHPDEIALARAIGTDQNIQRSKLDTRVLHRGVPLDVQLPDPRWRHGRQSTAHRLGG
jgi:hypothetical protein